MTETTTHVEDLLAANRVFAETWTNPAAMKQLREVVTDPTLVLTCMDPRVVPEQFLGPRAMVAVYRNAGGRFNMDVVRTVSVLRSLFHKAKAPVVMVVHHTDCGMTHLADAEIRDVLGAHTTEEHETLQQMDLGCFAAEDLEKSVRVDVEALRKQKLLKGVDVKGYVLSTETGLLRELEIS